MWKCVNCGEEENEDSYNFCSTCGTPKLRPDKALATRQDMDLETAFSVFNDHSHKRNGENHGGEAATATTTPAHRWHRPHPLRAIGQKVKEALPIYNGQLNHVKVSPAAQDKLTTLVQAGVFRSKAEAAAYLIERGITAETKLFDVVRQKLTEIERIELELRSLVKHDSE
jgi:hypothetical protein